MKTVTVNYYTIDELKEVSPQGYQNAYYKFADSEGQHYNWLTEVVESVEKFLGLFNCRLNEFVIGSVYNDDYNYSDEYIYLGDDSYEIDELEGEKLKEYLKAEHGKIIADYNRCPLAGIWIDIDILEPLHEYLNENKHQHSTLRDLIDMGMSRALNSADADFEYQSSKEAFEEKSKDENIYYDINGNQE